MNYSDIPRLYTALAEWGACLVYILPMQRRLNGWRLWVAITGSLVVQSLFLTLTDDLSLPLWIPCMAIAVCMMFGLIHWCRGGRLADNAYCCIHAFIQAELSASLLWQLRSFYFPNGSPWDLQSLLTLAVVYSAVFLLLAGLVRQFFPKDGRLDITPKELATAAAIGVVVFAMSNLSFVTDKTPFSGQYDLEIMNIRTLIDLGGAIFLFAHLLQCVELRTRWELDATQKLLDSQYQQYQQSKENIEALNLKYHDLKHQIEYLRMESDKDKRNAFLDDMADQIQRYEMENKTGNKVLDVLLTSKGMICKKENIAFTSVADGKLLDHIETIDLCALVGNAMDNAIECEKNIADPEKRLIHLTLSAQKSFVLLRIENYCDKKLRFHNGLPVTTKKDRENHGYGLKSVCQMAEKYGGYATVTLENKWFELKILIPQRETANEN